MRQEIRGWGWPPTQVEHYLDSLKKDGQPTAYLFQCRVCATLSCGGLGLAERTTAAWE
ncbi:CbrC family protein [Streptomyces sp. NPDC002730]|uniref:CbrC family protein n=1 Tax=Streptomyces sp. NPDC002730 TaxID=3364662 RepID=UPI003690F26C